MAIYQNVKEDANGNVLVNLNDGAGTALTSTNNGGKQSLDVNVTSTSSSGAIADTSTFTAAVSNQTPIGGVFDDTPIADLTTGKSGGIRATAKRGLHVNLRSAAGVELGTSGAPVRVDPTGTTTQPISAASLPLPSGAATEATLAIISGKMSPASAALTNVAASITSVSVLASNAARKGMVLVNDSFSVCYIAFAASASATSFTVKLQANAVYEGPSWVYTGAISGIWVSATGSLRVTEVS